VLVKEELIERIVLEVPLLKNICASENNHPPVSD
jgi:hypothetical protein